MTFPKKSQITIFILVGLVVFLVLVVGYILYNEFALDDSTAEFIEATTPQTPLQTFVQQCIAIQTRDAIERLGEQGGYIDVPFTTKQNRQLTISPHPSREYVIPYWVNKDQVLIPTVSQMEDELGAYISRTLPFCLNDFALLGDTGDVTKVDDPKATVTITNTNVVVKVDYGITRSTRGYSQSFEQFVYKEPIALLDILESAGDFAQSLGSSTFLEDMTIDLMSISDPIVPLSNMRLRCDPQIWLESKVQKDFSEILYYNIPSIRVKGAELTPWEQPESVYRELDKISVDDFADGLPYDPKELPGDTYQHAHMYYDGGQSREFFKSGVTIAARYLPEYGMDFAARPATNGKMQSSVGEGVGKYLDYICVQVYHFTYDISYPVEFVFRDESAFADGSPFILRFAVSVNIDHNLPDKSPLTNANPVLIGDYEPIASQICESRDGPINTLIASDSNSALDIANVEVNFVCHKYLCSLGNTSLQDGRAVLRTQLPSSCYGGKLQFVKDGYISEELSVIEGTEIAQQTYQADLVPLIDVTYKVVLGQNENSIIPTELNERQYAVVILEDQLSDFEAYATFDDQIRPILSIPDRGTIYNMTVLVYDDEEFIGGYISELVVDQRRLRERLTIHTYEFLPRPRGDDAFIEAWTTLKDDDVYKQYYKPKWG